MYTVAWGQRQGGQGRDAHKEHLKYRGGVGVGQMDTMTRWQHMSGRKTSTAQLLELRRRRRMVSERRPWEEMCFQMVAGPTALGRKAGPVRKQPPQRAQRWVDTAGQGGWRGSGRPALRAGLPHPLGLLQLLRQLLQGGRVSLPHVLDLSLMVLSFFLKSLLQLCHFLFTFCTGEMCFRESSSELVG